MPKYSVKPGRGPSFMGGVGALAAVAFGIFWTILAAGLGAPAFFPLFGVVFILIGIANAVYSFTNATRKDRYSVLDVTTEDEEPDPLNLRFGRQPSSAQRGEHRDTGERNADRFCPYCGEGIQSGFVFCPSCGRKQPE